MLKHHSQNRHNSPPEQRLIRNERQVIVILNHKPTLERPILVLWELLLDTDTLKVAQGLDFKKLDAHPDIVHGGTAQPRERLETFFLAVAVHQVSRALRHEGDHANGEDCRGE